MKIYEINAEITRCIEAIEENAHDYYNDYINTEVSDKAWQLAKEKAYSEGRDTLEMLKLEKEEKIESLVDEYRNTKALHAGIDNEIKTLKTRKDEVTQRLNMLEEMITFLAAGEKIENEHFKVSYRTSKAVQITNFDDISSEYLKAEMEKIPLYALPEELKQYVKDMTVDKVAIKKAIQEGKNVKGAEIEERKNLQIK